MTTAASTVDDAVRQVARGERPWTDLRAFGMDLQPHAGRAERLPPTGARISVHDLARGFLSCWDDPTALREWAFVLEAVDADFAAVEAHPDGEALLLALSKASFGDSITEDEREIIRRLARSQDA
jgi:hypothetical protein